MPGELRLMTGTWLIDRELGLMSRWSGGRLFLWLVPDRHVLLDHGQ